MFKIKMADFVIEIDNKYDFIEKQCRDYITREQNIDFHISCSEKDIEEEKSKNKECNFQNGYIESVCIYRNLCLILPKYDAFVMHAAVIETGGMAYAFTAKSGTGKSTHIMLWKKYLGEENVTIVNGDKPILRLINGELFAYGTPWCGKEGWNTNTKAKLNGICFIERDEINHIEQISRYDAATRIIKQILIPTDEECAIKTFELVDKMINMTNAWILSCNISLEAAKIAYETMLKEQL